MELLFLCVVVFLFTLAIFDLSVGVSNDAVNFLNSSLGSKAGSFKRVLIVASIGVFLGAAMSNGMMEIARHGIFRPEHFAFYDLICIFMAVMVTDIILLDIFNSLGMPTSTTVSMVFELLGATFVVAIIKMAGGAAEGFDQLLNTEKALQVIMGIFLSVAIAFVFGTVVQFLTRLLFSFNYHKGLTWKIGLFGGVSITAIVYFLLLKGAKDMSFMTPEVKQWINDNTAMILMGSMVGFSLLMQLLHALGVNVLKVVVLTGTFALAMAFAGNDLVNFIGVPLSGLASYQDYIANGGGDYMGHTMGALNSPASTPIYFLIGAGVIMVVSLATSRKARNVAKTEIGLGSSHEGDEMFGSSAIARRLVRWSLRVIEWVRDVTPARVRRAFNRRFNTDETVMADGAAFDLVRGSVNLVLAGALIALGTSLKLPLSTTFVTFMVAMGTSLADRAWSRESAVFRITGVVSVIGGWFLTAGVAFIGAGIIVAAMHYGGMWVMLTLALLTVALIIRSNMRFRKRMQAEKADTQFQALMANTDRAKAWPLLRDYIITNQGMFLADARDFFDTIAKAFPGDSPRALSKIEQRLRRAKAELKNARRRETLALRNVDPRTAIEENAWFHLSNNCCLGILYNLMRMNEMCKEHIDNNFRPLPEEYAAKLAAINTEVSILMNDILELMKISDTDAIGQLRRKAEELKGTLSDAYHSAQEQLNTNDPSTMTVVYVYINVLQETREMVSMLRKYLRAYAKLLKADYRLAR